MKSNIYSYFLFGIFLLILSSCAEKRNLTYFNDINDSTAFQQAIVKTHEPRIQKGDILSITVSSLDPTSNAMFNTGTILQGSTSQLNTAGTTNIGKEGYLVGNDGMINFPIIGKINLTGLTLTEAHTQMREELIKYVKDPIVNLRYLNFKVTVIGEVNRPSTFTVDNDRINVLEALGLAGDMTAFGRRENVLVIREANGTRYMERLDLSKSSTFSSPYFYLNQNDIVYVEPDVMKEKNVSRNPNTIPIFLAAISVITLVVSRFL